MRTALHSSEEALLQDMDLPSMDLPPQERIQQLMATRNEWKLYARTCDATGENILSAYPADSPYKVFRNDVWWGDSWDALDYGRDYDFNRPFFEQFYELQLDVPREGTSIFQSENCDYNSHIRQSRNCYLNSLVVDAEDMYYSYWMVHVENMTDCCFHINGKSSVGYECIDFGDCYECTFLQEGYNCNDCHFSYQLRGCDHCLFCSNLTKKSYHIENKPCTKEEFEARKAELLSGSYSALQQGTMQWESVRGSALHRASNTMNCENVTGDHLFDSRNCFNCFDGNLGEDCSNIVSYNDSKDVHSCHSAGWQRCERLWNCSVSRGCIDMAFTRYMWFCNSMRYCDSCQTCKNGFGCIGLRHKDYCILNKQYTKEEYETLLPRVISHMKETGEWGQFWPFKTLPFAYNESSAMDYFPLSRDEALAKGYLWRDTEDTTPEVAKSIAAADLPDALSDISDDILNTPILCAESGRPFKIIKGELEFYRRMNLPLPRIHPELRHKRRMQQRNPYLLFDGTCTQCGTAMPTSFAPGTAEKLLCEQCYLAAVY